MPPPVPPVSSTESKADVLPALAQPACLTPDFWQSLPEVDLYGAGLAVNALLFDAPVVLYVNHEYAIEGTPFAGMANWYARINWGDGDEEDFECGEIVSHIYRAAIDRSAITLTVLSPEPKSRTVLVEVRRRGFRETELDVTPPLRTP
jgi:hypothetical protein